MRHRVPRPRAVLRVALGAVSLATFAHTAAAQSTQTEWWPGVDVAWRTSERMRLLFRAQLEDEPENDKDTGLLGLHVDYLGLPRGYARLGYRYYGAVSGSGSHENRVLGETTLYFPSGKVRFESRTRYESRWLEAGWSWRLRQRGRLERRIHPWGGSWLPYVMAEGFYDSRYNAISQERYSLGNEFTLRRGVDLDLAYVRQDQTRSKVRHLIVGQARLIVTFDRRRK